MNFTPADSFSVIAFSIFSMVMFAFITGIVWRTKYKVKQFLFLFITYLLIFCGIVQSGLPNRHVLPFLPLLFLSIILISVFFALSEYGRKISEMYPLMVIIGFQSFRLPLEIILHHWAEIGTIPKTMTWTGQNWDVLTGILSLLAIPFLNKSKLVAYAVQIFGFILLLNVIRVVVMSSPLPFAWPLENPIQLIGYLPYALIGPLFVGAALSAHIIAFHKLIRQR